MDEFSQSREDDDLFADEFESVIEAPRGVVDHSETVGTGIEGAEQEYTAAEGYRAAGHKQQRNGSRGGRGQGGRERGEGERRGRGGGQFNQSSGLSAPQYATKSPELQPTNYTNSAPSEPPTNTTITTSHEPSDASSVPRNPTPPIEPQRIPAVRGDRSATGGPTHKKLTEEELTAKMAKMAIFNAQKAERHRLSEADQAAFQHREKELAEERKEKAVAEKRNERAMEMERAKNRERKIKAQARREWDSEKVESDIVDGKNRGRSSEYVRGGHGGIMRGGGGLGASSYASEDTGESEYTSQYRGDRGGRGGGGGRGGTRGGKPSTTTVPTAEDFPSLPTAPKTTIPAATSETPSMPPAETPAVNSGVSPMAENRQHDWAEEMATSIAGHSGWS